MKDPEGQLNLTGTFPWDEGQIKRRCTGAWQGCGVKATVLLSDHNRPSLVLLPIIPLPKGALALWVATMQGKSRALGHCKCVARETHTHVSSRMHQGKRRLGHLWPLRMPIWGCTHTGWKAGGRVRDQLHGQSHHTSLVAPCVIQPRPRALAPTRELRQATCS